MLSATQKKLKIAIGGPSHYGKSVFIEALDKNLDKDDVFSFSTRPNSHGGYDLIDSMFSVAYGLGELGKYWAGSFLYLLWSEHLRR